MKECINCKAQLEDDELFCHECGTKQKIQNVKAQVEEGQESWGKKCIHCGEAIEADSMFCPFCGKPQDVKVTRNEEPQPKVEEPSSELEEPQIKEEPKQEEPRQEDSPVEEEQTSQQGEKKKSNLSGCFLAIVGSLLIIGGVIWYFDLIQLNTDVVEEDIVKVENSDENIIEDAPKSALAFLDQFYKGEYENEDYIKKHATANVVNKLKRDCDYSDDCLATWVFSAFPAGADLNLEEGPIIRESGEKGKFKVDFVYSGYGENKPYYRNTVYLTVTELDGKYMISDYEVEIAEEKEGILSFEDALRVAEEMVIKNDEFKGFRSPENVKNIMANNGYKYAGKYYVDREFLFDVLFYKDCLLGKSTGDGCYSNVPQAGGSGTPSFMGIDNGQLYLAPFNKTAFDVFLNQAKEFGATMKENDESSISYKYLNFEITGFKNGVKSIKYCIIITKEEEID